VAHGLLFARAMRWLCVPLFLSCGAGFDASVVAWDARWGDEGTLDLYVPAHATTAVVLAHQGGWTSGDKSDLNVEANRLARAGFVVANTNYRLAPGVQFPAPVQDVACALAYVQAHAQELGVQRTALLGYSAGANLAAMVALGAVPAGDCPNGTAAAPTSVVLGAAPTDLLHLPSPGDGVLENYLGASKAQDPAAYVAASPAFEVKPGAPPIMLVQGTGDLYVPSAQAWALHDALEAAGDSVELLLVEGGGHTLNPGAEAGAATFGELVIDGPDTWPEVVAFLEGSR
jgi:acetyl esterase/lipase